MKIGTWSGCSLERKIKPKNNIKKNPLAFYLINNLITYYKILKC